MLHESSSQKPWRTYLSLGLSALVMVFFLIQAVTLGAVLVVMLLAGSAVGEQTIPVALLLWTSLITGLLLLPVVLLSWYELRGKETPRWLETGRPRIRKALFWSILAWPAVVALGWLVAGSPNAAVFLLGPINLLAAGLPVLWIYNSATWKLHGGPQQRQWRIFGFSLTVMPILVILVELVAVFFLVVLGGIYVSHRVSADPALEQELSFLVEQITASGQDIERILGLLEPYFLQPGVLVWAAAIMGGIMPIIEEVVKPIAIWPMARTGISPQEGFVAGLLCGAGFALTENLLYFTMAVNAEDWLFMAIGRAGTGILHMLASGLVGWGLAATWRSGKWGLQALLSFGSFVLHGLWNVLALFVGVAPGAVLDAEPGFWENMVFNVPIILLLILSVLALALANRHFRRDCKKPLENKDGQVDPAGV